MKNNVVGLKVARENKDPDFVRVLKEKLEYVEKNPGLVTGLVVIDITDTDINMTASGMNEYDLISALEISKFNVLNDL